MLYRTVQLLKIALKGVFAGNFSKFKSMFKKSILAYF